MSRYPKFFNWCQVTEPPKYNFRQIAQPIVAVLAITILISSIVGAAFFISSTSVAPLVDDVAKSINNNSTNQTISASYSASDNPESIGSTIDTPASTVQPTNQSVFKVSGYVKDSSGNGISGAEIIFCVPDIIPGVFTDSSGYYQVSAPAGTYHVYVWPPFDASYISFEQREFVVNADIAKNVTLKSGDKLSGYITDYAGKPVSGAIVEMGKFFNGYYSTASGYYYIVGQPGTYTLIAHPKTGVSFTTYTETNFVFSGNANKNIIVSSQTAFKVSGYVKDSSGNPLAGAEIIFGVPNIIPSVLTNNAGYYEVNAPAGTYTMDVWPPFDSSFLSFEQSGFTVSGVQTKNVTLTSGFKIYGYIKDASENPIRGALISLGNHISGWYSRDNGYYFATAPAGTYTLMAQSKTGPSFTTYTEKNVEVNSDICKNIHVGNVVATQTPVPTSPPDSTATPTPTSTVTPTPTSPNTATISGYVRDSSGNGLANAMVQLLSNNMQPIYTDASGHYSITGPVGTYTLRVLQPYDSNFLTYKEANVAVNSDVSKNVVLTFGYKVTGYITDTAGNPISGATISVGSYHCTYYSKADGYFYATAPAGTYSLTIIPVAGHSSFITKTIDNIVVNGNVVQNVVVTR
jgi:protocatechuate 3,4-dioxygenase beta subunit